MKCKKETTYSFTSFDTNAYIYDCKLKIPYAKIYKNAKTRSDYSDLFDCKNYPGIYFFADQNHNVIYVGESHGRSLFDRVTQHFSEDSGGLRHKLKQANRTDLIPELEKSVLYIFEVPMADRRDILYAESYFIGIYRPKLNFLSKEK